MNAFILRLIAIIAMTMDHASYFIYGPHLSWMNFIGRLAFPIFAFQISEGFYHTHDLKKYFTRLLVFAIISQIPYTWFAYYFFTSTGLNINIIFTLILGLSAITIYDFLLKKSKTVKKNKASTYIYLGLLIAIVIGLIAEIFDFDYGYYGVGIIFLFYLFHNNKALTNISILVLTIMYYIPFWLASNFDIRYLILFIFSLVPLIPINLYNGKQGRKSKWLFYIYYPVHILIICLLTYFFR